MSYITYNNITIHDVQTQSIDQTLMVDKTNSDYVALKVTLSVTGILHKDASVTTFGTYVGIGTDNLLAFSSYVQSLSQPRRSFLYAIGEVGSETVVWRVMPISTDNAAQEWSGAYYVSNDALPATSNGPVTTCTINKVIGRHSAHVTFTIEFTYLPCSWDVPSAADARKLENIASLRWWYADDIDCRTWLNVRTTKGRLEMLSRSAGRNLNAMRFITIPPLQYGWKRDVLSWSESDDGFSFDFTCRDSELIAAAPYPACEWSGTVRLSAPFAGAGANQAQMDCTLTGPKGVTKLELIDLLIRILDAKLNWLNKVETLEGGEEKGTFCTEFQVGENLGASDNSVFGSVEVMYTKGYEEVNLIKLIKDIFGFDLAYIPAKPPADDDPGSAERGLKGYDPQRSYYVAPLPRSFAGWFFCNLQNPCSPNTIIAQAPPAYPTKPQDQSPPEKPTEEGQRPDDQQGGGGTPPEGDSAPDGDSAVTNPPNTPYMAYQITAKYHTVEGRSYAGVMQTYNSPTARTVVTRVHGPVTLLSMRFGATRLNKWPKMPSREDWEDPETGLNYYVLEHTISPNAGQVSADGRKIAYSAIAEVTYVLSRSPSPNEKLFVGALPYVDKAKLEGNVSDLLYFDGSGLKTPIDFDGIPDPGDTGPDTGGGDGGTGGGLPGDGFPPNEGDDSPPNQGGSGGTDAPPTPPIS